MNKIKNFNALRYCLPTLLFLTFSLVVNSQISQGIYADTLVQNGIKKIHQVKLNSDYFIYTAYENEPSKFIKTMGGFVKFEKTNADTLMIVLLEFNSNYEQDSIRRLSIPVKMMKEQLHLNWFEKLELNPIDAYTQDLDGKWLFATKGPDTGQERRSEENTRKTLKFLKDGTFQWIAYDTDSFKFSGTGGGSFTSKNGIYTEHIAFFSKDASRVGANLKFNYELKGNDWHHTGKNSKGEPMYEIWAKRE